MTVEELQVLITANTKDFNAKIDKANKRLGSLEQQATRTGAGVGKLFTGIKTTAAVAAIQKVVSEVKKLTDAYAENEAAQMGLSSILTAQGKDLNAAKAWLKSYTKDGLIPMMDAYTAYKSLAAAGYSDEQTQSILTNLKDSAAFNRQGSMTMGEAIKSAAEGIKNENSILVDNAGVTKNLSVIWDEYAASIGKTAATLTDAEKRIATTQGIMRETAFQTGDAAKYSNTLAGAQAALKAQTKMLSSALGSMFAPALQQCIPHVTALLERLTALAEKAGQVMAILFGTSSATSQTSSNTSKLANSTQQVSTNLGSAAKKAKDYKNAMAKTNTGLVAYAQANLGNPYWYGTFGQTGTQNLLDSKRNQYPSFYTNARYSECKKDIGKRVHDCVGLIKGYLWSDSSTAAPRYNAAQDVSANGMLSKCTEHGNIGKMPEIPGVLVFMDGHVGVYEGNGYVIECTVARGGGVIRTALNSRPWVHWGKCPWISYNSTTAAQKPSESTSKPTSGVKVGDKVRITGTNYATGQRVPTWVKLRKYTVSKLQDGKALLKEISSWVYIKDVTVVSTVKKGIAVGSTVTIKKGAVYGGLSGARGKPVPAAQLAPAKHKISKIQTNKGVKEALLGDISSWVAVSSLTEV